MESVAAVSQSTAPELAFVSQGKGMPVQKNHASSGDAQTPAGSQQSAESVAKDLNSAVKIFNTNLSFSVDKDSGKEVIKVIDSATKEVIRQIPPEDVLRIAAHLKELMGILYDDKR